MKNLHGENLPLFRKIHISLKYIKKIRNVFFGNVFVFFLSKFVCEIKHNSVVNEKSYLPKCTQNAKLFSKCGLPLKAS